MKIIIVGNIASGKSTIAAKLAEQTKFQLLQIDAYRKLHGDGSREADHAAKRAFADACGMPGNFVIELLGTGQTALMVYRAVYNYPTMVFGIYATPATCLSRYKQRPPHTFKIPDYGTDCANIIHNYNYNHPKAIFAPKPFFLVENANGTPHSQVINQIISHCHDYR